MYLANGIRKFFGPKRDPKGDYEMMKSVEFSEKCFPCEEIVLNNEELERDIRRLQSMIVATDNYYTEIYEKHCDLPGFVSIHQHLGRAVGQPDELLKVLPEE